MHAAEPSSDSSHRSCRRCHRRTRLYLFWPGAPSCHSRPMRPVQGSIRH